MIRTALNLLTFIIFSQSIFCQIPGQYFSPSDGEFQLSKRSSGLKILYLAAHPDDENTRLIAHWSKYDGYEVAYLSLTRGEGGQNMIGPELGKSLGVIRSNELLAARKLDGAKQYFGGAIDFGYSKSVNETLEKWDEEKVLNRIEFVISEFQPDIIVTRFPPDERAGHGHHTASAILAIKAFDRIRSKSNTNGYFPKAVYWNTSSWWMDDLDRSLSNDSMKMIKIGGFIPEIGKSSLEIGTRARGMHKSQGFAGFIDRGFRNEYLQLLAGEPINWSKDVKKTAQSDLVNLEGVYVDFRADSPYFIDGETLDSEIHICLESDINFSFAIMDSDGGYLFEKTKLEIGKKIIIPIELITLEKKNILFLNEDSGVENILTLWPNHVTSDRVKGEVRRPVQKANSFSVDYEMPCLVFVDKVKRELDISVFRWGIEKTVKLRFEAPKGWDIKIENLKDNILNFSPGQNVSHLKMYLRPNQNAQLGELVVLDESNGLKLKRAVKLRYDHIPHQEVWLDGALQIRYIPMKLPSLKVGYIKGVGDDTPMAMEQMGIDVIELDTDILTANQLTDLDAIVIGIRGFNVNKGLSSAHSIISDYVKSGGRLVMQYNTASRDKVMEEFGPIQFHLSRNRVTVEEVSPKFLSTDHIQMNSPNRLSEKDFAGWVQERGLYFADSWDSSFVPLISWNDPGEDEKKGVWLAANYGKGTVTYCSLSLFRQWREGVPGAYRILANLVGHGK
ncbi:MAG: Mycothiol S-conjugate amidase [Owenweeksia sp. TMED14]|nr:MAG: Mycothiol S-conjugate amidase [Owenweeksia sp. TMED14]